VEETGQCRRRGADIALPPVAAGNGQLVRKLLWSGLLNCFVRRSEAIGQLPTSIGGEIRRFHNVTRRHSMQLGELDHSLF